MQPRIRILEYFLRAVNLRKTNTFYFAIVLFLTGNGVLLVPNYLTGSLYRVTDKYEYNRKVTSFDFEMCIVTAVFGDDIASADKLINVTPWFNDSSLFVSPQESPLQPWFHFLLFTDLPDIQADGWEKVTPAQMDSINISRYYRTITRSRYPKFMGWKEEELVRRRCQTVFYVDATYEFHRHNASIMREIAGIVAQPSTTIGNTTIPSPGFAQYLHPQKGGPTEEFRRIMRHRKDTEMNVNKSLAWLRNQSDFPSTAKEEKERCPIYWNSVLGAWNTAGEQTY
jgi:hypothetical protein